MNADTIDYFMLVDEYMVYYLMGSRKLNNVWLPWWLLTLLSMLDMNCLKVYLMRLCLIFWSMMSCMWFGSKHWARFDVCDRSADLTCIEKWPSKHGASSEKPWSLEGRYVVTKVTCWSAGLSEYKCHRQNGRLQWTTLRGCTSLLLNDEIELWWFGVTTI